MNQQLIEIYRSCRSKEALASQDEYQSANVLLGAEVEKFAELIVGECARWLGNREFASSEALKQHFGIKS